MDITIDAGSPVPPYEQVRLRIDAGSKSTVDRFWSGLAVFVRRPFAVLSRILMTAQPTGATGNPR
jgi:hypothetical protein